MYDYLPQLLVLVLGFGAYQLVRIHERLRVHEARLNALMRHFGVAYGSLAEPSDEIKQMIKDPRQRIEAIKAFREQTGAGLKEAKEVIDALAEKHPSEGP